MRKTIVDVRPWTFDLTRHDTPPAPPADPAPPVTDPQPSPTDPPADAGFPVNTPLAEMTVEQREAYWKHHARKHENQVKALNLKPGELEQLREAAKKLSELQESQKSDTDKAISEAENRGRTEALSVAGERLARAEFKAEAAGRIPEIDAVLDDLNLTKYVKDGEPDIEGIKAAVTRLASLAPKAPVPDLHQGARGGGDPANLRNADPATFAAELAKYGLKPRS